MIKTDDSPIKLKVDEELKIPELPYDAMTNWDKSESYIKDKD